MSGDARAVLTPVVGAEVTAALRRAGHGNPFLGIEVDPQAGTPPDRLSGMAADQLGRVAADLIDVVGARLGGAERRVAASMVVLGYSARLVGPAVSALLGEDLLLDLSPSNVRFSYDPRAGFSVQLVRPAGWRGDRAALRAAWGQVIVDGHLRTLIEAVRTVEPVSAALLWGNVASGLAGAVRAVASAGAAPASRCYADGSSLLGYGPLHGSGDLTDGLHFVRRSCCLYYRIEGGGMCGDCALRYPRVRV